MNNTEKLMKLIDDEKIEIHSLPLKGTTKGLYGDGVIAISDKVTITTDLACIIAEEIGHHKTSYGDILNLKDEKSRKQELRARGWAYSELILLPSIIEAFGKGCRSWYDIAEYIDVTEEFLKDAIEYFKNKYGIYKVVENYIVYFEPFGVMEILEEV